MIPTTSKLARSAAFVLLVSLLVPQAFVFARESSEAPRGLDGIKAKIASTTNKGTGGQNFCQNVDKFATEITTRIPKREDTRNTALDTRKNNVVSREAARTEKLDDNRDKWDENRTERYTKLEDHATTTAQKAAVDTFKSEVEAAVKVRRDAVDAAITTFRLGTDQLIADRQAKVDAAFATLKTTTDTAIAKAKADCASGIDPKTVRDTFKAALQTANDTFKNAVKPAGDVDSKIKTLRDARDASIKTALDAFKKSFDASLAKLKLAFKG